MTHTPNTRSRVNPDYILVSPLVDIAISVAFSIALVKAPVHFVRDSVLAKISGLLRHTAARSANGAYYVLRNVANNKLTRRISPSVSLLDSKIENSCSIAGKLVGSALVFPFTSAFYLVAAAYAAAISVAAVAVIAVKLSLEYAWNISVGKRKYLYEEVISKTKEDAACYENTASKAAYMISQVSWKLPLLAVILPVVGSAFHALIRALSLVPAPFLAPVYMLSSVFGLDNRFNIYNYESDIGTVHGYIQDMLEKNHNGGSFLPSYACNRLIEEATTEDVYSVSTVATDSIPTKLQSPELEHSTQTERCTVK